MKFLHLTSLALALMCGPGSIYASGPVTGVRTEPVCDRGMASDSDCASRVMISTAAGTLEITPLTEDIFKVTVIPLGEKVPVPVSQSAVLSPSLPARALKMDADAKGITLTTATTRVSVNRATGLVSFYDSEGNLLLSEKGGVDNTNPKDRRISFSYPQGGEMFYGGGERGHSLKINGDTLVMYNRQNYGYTGSDPRIRQMNITMPLLVAPEGYGILMDDYAAAEMVAASPLKYASESPSSLSYYFFASPDGMPGVSRQVADLTGHQDLPPFWSLGYITSKYG